MKNLNWIKEGKMYSLYNEDALLLTLNMTSAATADIFVNDSKYLISKKGAWNPTFCMTSNGKEILNLTHSFWGSNGKISCADGAVYKCVYLNKAGVQVRFLHGENVLLSYHHSLVAKQPVVNFTIGTSMEDAEKLLLLAALGMMLFVSLVGENNNNNDDNAMLLLMAAVS